MDELFKYYCTLSTASTPPSQAGSPPLLVDQPDPVPALELNRSMPNSDNPTSDMACGELATASEPVTPYMGTDIFASPQPAQASTSWAAHTRQHGTVDLVAYAIAPQRPHSSYVPAGGMFPSLPGNMSFDAEWCASQLGLDINMSNGDQLPPIPTPSSSYFSWGPPPPASTQGLYETPFIPPAHLLPAPTAGSSSSTSASIVHGETMAAAATHSQQPTGLAAVGQPPGLVIANQPAAPMDLDSTLTPGTRFMNSLGGIESLYSRITGTPDLATSASPPPPTPTPTPPPSWPGTIRRARSNGGGGGRQNYRNLPRNSVSREQKICNYRWLLRNMRHPFPTEADRRGCLAVDDITQTQSKNWFANVRCRQFTKHRDAQGNIFFQPQAKFYESCQRLGLAIPADIPPEIRQDIRRPRRMSRP
ncbi:hypothetical protein GGF46_004385 [Coemansia sp. RSA 552]|nr:hypothetical protein GGF46_004385 [Coemansia sp. RSA 552]